VNTWQNIWRPANFSRKSSWEIVQKGHYQFFLEIIRQKTIIDRLADLVQSYKDMGCNMSLKVHFLYSHSDFFPEYLGAVSDEHRQRFHQDISTTEKGTKASGVPVCWLIIAGHLEETVHRQNIAESHPLLLFCIYSLWYNVNTGCLWTYPCVTYKPFLILKKPKTYLNSLQKMLFGLPTLVCVARNKNYSVIQC